MRRRVNRLTDGHAEKVTDEAPAADETTDIDVISFVHGSDVISPRHAPMGIHALNGAIATAPLSNLLKTLTLRATMDGHLFTPAPRKDMYSLSKI